MISIPSFAKEVPGKTHLFPNQEIRFAHLDGNSQLVSDRNSFKVSNIFDGEKRIEVTFQANQIKKLTLLKEQPELRGRLIESYEDDDRKFLTQLHLRLELEGPVEVKDLIFSYDFKLENEQQVKLLESDFRNIDLIKAPMHIQVRTLRDISSRMKKFEKEIWQYSLGLNKKEIIHIVQELFKNQRLDVFNSEKMTSSTLIWEHITNALKRYRGFQFVEESRIRIHGNNSRSRTAWNELKIKKISSNPSLLEKNLEIRKLDTFLEDFRYYSLANELCIKFKNTVSLNCFEHLITDREDIENQLVRLEGEIKERSNLKHQYIHKGFEKRVDNIVSKLLMYDNYLLAHQNEENQILRLKTWGKFLEIVSLNSEYDEIRFFEEGGFYKEYSRFFVRRIVDQFLRLNDDQLSYSGLSRGFLIEIRDRYIDTDLVHLGNELGNNLINVLGQIFKKRDWVPYIRLSTNFRENHLTKYRERVFKDLFHENGMKPGDILVEKDLQANTDVLIPGYWIHAAIYLGSINDMKKMGIWNDPRIDVIQYEIEKYRTSKDRQYYLNEVWQNKLNFEDIPWFYESDRPGVGVHPFIKFLRTDGMAVLRPTKNWELPNIFEIFERANERMYFIYDYNHNVRNKFSVSCSKVVLKVFDQITFPVSHNLGYVSVSPDQIAQPVSPDPRRPELGELKLLMFLDAYQDGKKVFDHSDEKTFGSYQQYLKVSGAR